MTYIDYLNDFNRWIEEDSLPDKAIILYYALLNMFNRRGWPEWAGVDIQRLMYLTRVTNKPTALRARDALAAAGFVQYRSGKKGRATEYRLLQKYGNKSDTENATQSVTKNVTQNVTESVTENVTPNKTKTKTKTGIPLTPFADWPNLQAAFESWLAYKSEKRQAYKPTGLQNLIIQIRGKAEEYGADAMADVIRESMAANYQGIVFDWLEKHKKAQQSDSLKPRRQWGWQ